MKIKIQPKQHHESKMTPEELQEYLKMCRNGASSTKNEKRYVRKPKHNKRLSYCWDFFYKKSTSRMWGASNNIKSRYNIPTHQL